MRIGVDFDDTLADFSAMLERETARRWETDLNSLYASGIKPLEHFGEAWSRLILDLLETEMSMELPVKEGALEVTQRLAERHDLVLLTARHDHEMALSRRWVELHGVPISEFHATSRGPKDGAARELGLRVHIDDTVTVFDTFVDHPTASALLAGRRGQANEPGTHVVTVEHWHRFEELVGEIESRG